MMKSEQINELAAALAKAQGEIKGAIKDSKNPYFKSNYADLSSVWEACHHALNKNGLAVTQPTTFTEHGVFLTTLLIHSSGQFIGGEYPINPQKQDPQGLGSAIKYARRYTLAAIVGVAEHDDDGEDAMERKQPPALVPASIKTVISKVEYDEFVAYCSQHGFKSSAVIELMKKKFGKEKISDLTTKQLKELISALWGDGNPPPLGAA